jgi:uncharacterized membrane protein YeaQ/YmgE (transglycosylase-associated protein family)
MHILWTILIGLIAGALARFIVPGNVGALVATFLGRAVGWYKAGESAGFIAATLGAILVLVVYHMIRKSPASA